MELASAGITDSVLIVFGIDKERRYSMFFGSTRYPFNFANRNGIPLIETSSISVTDDNVVFALPNRAFRWLN